MRKWVLKWDDYHQNHHLYEDAPLGKQILTHINSNELKRIKPIVDHHNLQVENLENKEDIRMILEEIKYVLSVLYPHLKPYDYRFKKGSSGEAIDRAYVNLYHLFNKLNSNNNFTVN